MTEDTVKRRPGRPARDLTDEEFGQLKVLYRVPGLRPPTWVCQCKCDPDRTVQVTSTQLLRGHVKSCGCLQGTWLRVRTDTLQRVAANLASLNEIIAELVTAGCDDPGFAQMTRDLLRDHSWSLGFQFQGQQAPADWTPWWEKTGEDQA
jgi:hypothetical protein